MLILPLANSAHAKFESLEQSYLVDGQRLVPIQVESGEYLRGGVQSDQALVSAAIVDANGHVVKQIVNEGDKDGELFWFVSQGGQYHLNLESVNPNSKVEVELESKPLKADQSVDPKEEVISPTLLTLIGNINQPNSDAEKAFWQSIEKTGTPLIEPKADGSALLTFLWKGDEDNVRLFGAPYDGHTNLSRIPNSQIWHKSYQIPNGSRLSYRIAPNVPQLKSNDWREQRRAVLATSAYDPLNIRPTFEGDDKFGAASTIEYGDIISDQYTHDIGSPKGSVSAYKVESHILSNTRSVKVYQPHPSYKVAKDAPLLIAFDGDQYLSRVPTQTILDNLIAEGKVPPMRALFINHPNKQLRGKELPPNPDFAKFMATELMPWAKETLGIQPLSANTVLTGSSYGGLASMYVAHQYPNVFGKVLSQSGSFWWGSSKFSSEWLTDEIEDEPKNTIQIYMNAGVFELQPEHANIIDTNRKLYKVLQEKQYKVEFEELASGHDYYSWRVTIANGLIHLFKS